MKYLLLTLTSLFSVLLLNTSGGLASADTLEVAPSLSDHFSNIPVNAQRGLGTDNQFTIKGHFSCFGTNLRSVMNPLSPHSIIVVKIEHNNGTGGINLISFEVPASIVQYGFTNASPISIISAPTNTSASALENSVLVIVPNIQLPTLALTSTGEIDRSQVDNMFRVTFEQRFPDSVAVGTYMGAEGVLTVNLQSVVSSDLNNISFRAAFPGQAGFCGGYYSPLMLFFDDRRPQFTGTTDKFNINAAGIASFWVEKDAPGYFLALDNDKNGVINRLSELFGSEDSKSNGFDELKKHDSNNDGLINSKDKVFTKLLLWRDQDADGVCKKSELKNLKDMGVEEIKLKYDRIVTGFGNRAEARERSNFTFMKNGKPQAGQIIDIWFLPKK